MEGQANEQSWQSAPYAFFVALLAIVGACLVFGFTLIGTIVGSYFGIKVSSDTSERSQGAIERAHGSTEGASRRAEQAHDTAQQVLAELEPHVVRRIVEGR